MKYDAIVDQGIAIHERVPIPERLIPEDSRVEIDAKIYAGYYTNEKVPSIEELSQVHGRAWYVHFPVNLDSLASRFVRNTLFLYSPSLPSGGFSLFWWSGAESKIYVGRMSTIDVGDTSSQSGRDLLDTCYWQFSQGRIRSIFDPFQIVVTNS